MSVHLAVPIGEADPLPLVGEAEGKVLRVRRQHFRGAGRGELLCFSHRGSFTIPAVVWSWRGIREAVH